MENRVNAWLYDILIAIDEIEGFLTGRAKFFFDYQGDLLLKRAIEREMEIIGEAMNRLLKSDSSLEHKITGKGYHRS
ncbi:MAG: hypothetical protein ACJAY8_000296 [Sphingobacteriales bacterium]|jgi:uncharacterized protein with HEPN domain